MKQKYVYGLAVALALIGDLISPAEIRTRGGEVLAVHFRRDHETLRDVALEGPAVITFTGELTEPLLP